MIQSDTISPSSLSSTAPPKPKPCLAGKRVAMVMFSFYPDDPRPRRAAEALAREAAQVDFICLAAKNTPDREQFGAIDVLRIPLKKQRQGKLEYFYQYAIFTLISAAILAMRSIRHRYDLVYVHNMPDVLVFSALVPKALGAKVILDQHDPMPELMTTIFGAHKNSLAVSLLRQLEKLSIAFADRVIAVNIACKRLFASRSCDPEKITVVMNSPDVEIFPFRAAPGYDFRNQSHDRRFVIMYHGSLVERNGLDLAVEALAQVREDIPGVELRIYGSKSAFLERVMGNARVKGVEQALRYLGPKRLEDLVPEIQNCDIGIIPNQRNEFTEINTPTRIFEYLALGKPVVAPRTPGIQDYFDEQSLLFFEAGNASDLGNAIKWVFNHPREITEFTRRGQRIYQEHDWQSERMQLVEAVSGLLGRKVTKNKTVTCEHEPEQDVTCLTPRR